VDALYRRMLLVRPGVDRLRMGFSMYSTARAFVVASLLETEPQASPERIRQAIFLRFYGRDFDDATRERILARLAGPRPPRRRVPIDWSDLEMALTWRSDEYDYYLDLHSGKVLAHAIWGDGEAGDLSEEQVDEGLARGRLVEVERLPSSMEYDWMVEFAASVPNPRLRELLDVALRGRGAFRRFKDVLVGDPAERGRWFAFHDARVREAMLEWLADQDIEPTIPPGRPRP
jgi:hypothetical protein